AASRWTSCRPCPGAEGHEAMSQGLIVGTRKGLFTVERNGTGRSGAWAVTVASFLGDPVTAVLPDPRGGAVFAALRHGHFGAKLHRSRDGGAGWQECATP